MLDAHTDSTLHNKAVQSLSAPYTLPCGLTVPNRLVKAPMAEMLGYFGGGDPSPAHLKLYAEWSKGGWGMNLTGNVQISSLHIGTPLDVVIPSQTRAESQDLFESWSRSTKSSPSQKLSLAIMQLNHPGRQSTLLPVRSRSSSFLPFTIPTPIAPSPIPLNAFGESMLGQVACRMVWGTPRGMGLDDIEEVKRGFVAGALWAKKTGWDGVELHCSHGYLLCQFLSPDTNVRTDSYGGSPKKRLRLVLEIITAIRAELPLESGFALGVKLNSADYVQGGLTEEDALDNIRWIAEHGGVDFIEISGGTYESFAFVQDDIDSAPTTASTPTSSPREAFFHTFSHQARSLLASLTSSSLPSPAPAILLTGGFRTRLGLSHALDSGVADLVGIGRPACVDFDLPLRFLDPGIEDGEARSRKYNIPGRGSVLRRVLGGLGPAGWGTVWHTLQLGLVSQGKQVEVEMGVVEGVWKVWMWPWLALKFESWWWSIAAVVVVILALGWAGSTVLF